MTASPARTRKQSQEATRAALRAAAAEEFAQRGVAGASIDAIAAAAGFTRGAFYANYRSKHDIIVEILDSIHNEELDAWGRTIRDSETLDGMFQGIADRFNAFASNERHAMLVAELRLQAQRDPDFARHYIASHALVFERAVATVERLIEKAGATHLEPLPVACALRALSIGLELDVEGRAAGAPSPGDVMALFLKQMLKAETKTRHE